MGKKAVQGLLVVFSVLAISCGLVRPPAPATPDESALQTRVAQDVAATLTAQPTATQPPSTPTQPPLAPTDTPNPPQPISTPIPTPSAKRRP